ncbi:MAG: hypothetical protein ACREQ4_16390 [Candidatus Binataceae bacterium]
MEAFRLSSLLAELEPVPKRWTRAARAALITALGAGVMAAMRIANPLGLTLLVSFAQPEAAFPLLRGAGFMFAAAIFQFLALFMTAALVQSPAAHLTAFIIIALVSTYVIYAVPTLGRLWIWIQVPVVTAFYVVMYQPGSLGWDNAGMFAGLAVAIALLCLFNNLIWPEPPEMVLADSLAATLHRSQRRLVLLIEIFSGRASADDDRPVASRLGYHLSLLGPAAHGADVPRRSATLLAYVMIAERIHNEIERVAAAVPESDEISEPYATELKALALRLDEQLSHHVESLPGHIAALENEDVEAPSIAATDPSLKAALADFATASSLHTIAGPMERICALLEFDPLEVPSTSERRITIQHEPITPNHFLVRFSVRHTIALTASFLIGLWDNNVALHAAIWLLMLGGPPSHGATARKFTMRALGSSGAMLLAALGTIIVAPNYTSPGPYMAAIFAGVLVMAYIGESGGILSYLAIGGTAFVIAYSGPGPRSDVIGSIWSVWGISLGMIIRAVVSLMWPEHAPRTLAEQFQAPLAPMVELLRRPAWSSPRGAADDGGIRYRQGNRGDADHRERRATRRTQFRYRLRQPGRCARYHAASGIPDRKHGTAH